MLVELTYDDFRTTGVKITVAQTTVSRGNVYDVTFYFFYVYSVDTVRKMSNASKSMIQMSKW